MNYTHTESDGQLAFSETRYSFLNIPSRLEGFNNSDTTVSRSVSGREVFCFNDKAVSEVRKDEQRRLYEEILAEEASWQSL